MKLYLILPLIAVSALAAMPADAFGRHLAGRGGGGGSLGGGGGGFKVGASAGGRSVAAGIGGRSVAAGIGGRSAAVARSATVAARGLAPVAASSGASVAHGHHGHHHHHHHHHRRYARFKRLPATYPQNFPNYGYQANYNTPYYVGGGFRQNTAPYGFMPTFQVGNPYATFRPYTSYGYPPYNRIFSYGTRAGFRGYSVPVTGQVYPAYVGTSYSPYYQGAAYPGYRPYGVYGPNGAYTVPAGGVGTAAIQSKLLNSGFYRGPVDGFAGPLTRAAIQRYQYAWGLPVTGRIDGALIQSMRQNSFYYSGW